MISATIVALPQAYDRAHIADSVCLSDAFRYAAAELVRRHGVVNAMDRGVELDECARLTLDASSSEALRVASLILTDTDAVRWQDDHGTSWALRIVAEDDLAWHAVAVSCGDDVRLLDAAFVAATVEAIGRDARRCLASRLHPESPLMATRLARAAVALRVWDAILPTIGFELLADAGRLTGIAVSSELIASALKAANDSTATFAASAGIVSVATVVSEWSGWRSTRFVVWKSGWAPVTTRGGPALVGYDRHSVDVQLVLSREFAQTWQEVFPGPLAVEKYEVGDATVAS